jgi:hypothetical protein
MRSAAVLLSSTRKSGWRYARRDAYFRRRAMRGGLQMLRRASQGTSIAAARCAYVDRRSAQRRRRPDIPPPAPDGFVPAVVH